MNSEEMTLLLTFEAKIDGFEGLMNICLAYPLVKKLLDILNHVPEPQDKKIGYEGISNTFVEVSVELGQTMKTIKDAAGIGYGQIIELDRLSGEPVDIIINKKRVAKGEVIVIDENFGVRVTEVL